MAIPYFKKYSRSYLMSWTKDSLIDYIECIYNNYEIAYNRSEHQYNYLHDFMDKNITELEVDPETHIISWKTKT